MKSKDNYEPFSEEWIKEVMKLPKRYIIENFLRPALIYKKAHQSGPSEDKIIDAHLAGQANAGCKHPSYSEARAYLITLESSPVVSSVQDKEYSRRLADLNHVVINACMNLYRLCEVDLAHSYLDKIIEQVKQFSQPNNSPAVSYGEGMAEALRKFNNKLALFQDRLPSELKIDWNNLYEKLTSLPPHHDQQTTI